MKKRLFYELFNFNLNMEHIPLHNFRLSSCLYSPNAFNQPKLCGNCAFPQNIHIRILGEITIFFAVILATKCISVPNFRGDFHVYIARQRATLTKSQNDVLAGNLNISTSILKLKFFFKHTCSTMTAWIHVCLLQLKSEMIYLTKRFL